MKSLQCIAFFLVTVFFNDLSAQNSFIDLTVSDTVMVKYKSITYQVRAVVPRDLEGSVSENADYQAQEKMMQSMLKDSEKQLRALMDDNKLNYKPSEDIYNVNQSGTQSPYFDIKFSKEEELKKFVKTLADHNFAEGNVSNVTYNYSEDLDFRLLERLTKKARERATKMAQLANATLGKILEMAEVPGGDGFPAPYPYEEGGYRNTYNNPVATSLSNHYSKTIRIKFEMIAK
jgi:Protein of unknown function (DUF541)